MIQNNTLGYYIKQNTLVYTNMLIQQRKGLETSYILVNV